MSAAPKKKKTPPAKKAAPKKKKTPPAKKAAPKPAPSAAEPAPDLEVFDPSQIPENDLPVSVRHHFNDDGTARDSFRPPVVGRPPKFPDVEALQNQIEMYFVFCQPHLKNLRTPVLMKDGAYKIVTQPRETTARPPTVSGLATFLGTNRQTLLEYENLAITEPDKLPAWLKHKDPKILKEFTDTIKYAKSLIEAAVEEALLGGRNAIGPIFNLKNNFRNWKDQSEILNPLDEENRRAIESLRDDMRNWGDSVKRKTTPTVPTAPARPPRP